MKEKARAVEVTAALGVVALRVAPVLRHTGRSMGQTLSHRPDKTSIIYS